MIKSNLYLYGIFCLIENYLSTRIIKQFVHTVTSLLGQEVSEVLQNLNYASADMGSSADDDDENSRGKWKIRKRWNSLPFPPLLWIWIREISSGRPMGEHNNDIRIQEDSVRVRSSRLEVAIHFRETEVWKMSQLGLGQLSQNRNWRLNNKISIVSALLIFQLISDHAWRLSETRGGGGLNY